MDSMRRPARRKALLIGAICGLSLLGAGVAFRGDLAFRYHLWELDRALTVEAARPLLAKLEDDVQDPARAHRLVAMLGPPRTRLTFWVFEWPDTPKPERLEKRPPSGELLHFARSLEDRARSDEAFRAVMAHFIRWNHRPWALLEVLEQPGPLNFLLSAFGNELVKSELLRQDAAIQEVFVRTQEAWLRAEAWLIGMTSFPPPVELNFPLSEADFYAMFRRWYELESWVRARRGRLRFDSASGRFVEVPAAQGISSRDLAKLRFGLLESTSPPLRSTPHNDPLPGREAEDPVITFSGSSDHKPTIRPNKSLVVPAPAEPLPGWTGPVPGVP
jgi:hypothetical protein